MAVLLCRGDGKPFPTPPPLEMRGLPRIVVNYEPIPEHTSYLGKTVEARTEVLFNCKDQTREEFWRKSRKRQQEQLTQCGFRSPLNKPYKEVGCVELDDSKLILKTLGQEMGKEVALRHKFKKPVSEKSPPQPVSMMSPYNIKLHSKTPSQFPTKLISLDQKLDEGQVLLGHVQRGRRLFGLVHEEEQKKKLREEKEQGMHSKRKEWKEAEVAADISTGFENRHLLDPGPQDPSDEKRPDSNTTTRGSRSMTRSSGGVARGRESPGGVAKRREPSGSVVKRRESSVGVAKGREPSGGVARGVELSAGVSTGRDLSSGGSSRRRDSSEGMSSQSEAGVNVVDQWHRQLCVMIWVLESMQLESPHYAIPLSKCFNLDCNYTDDVVGKKLFEHNKEKLAEWHDLYTSVGVEKNLSVLRSKVSTFIAFRKPFSPKRAISIAASTAKEEEEKASSTSVTKSQSLSQMEEEKMRKQKKLTPSQMASLVTLLEEELNYSQKQSRSRINALIAQQSGQKKNTERILKKWATRVPPVTLDLDAMQRRFIDSEEEREMIVHEQLTAMERDRKEALQQRLEALHVSGNLWSDLAAMRKGVEIESSEMARKKILMNYNGFRNWLQCYQRRSRVTVTVCTCWRA